MGFPKQGNLYGHLQDWNVINEDEPLCQGLLYFQFYFDVGENPLEKTVLLQRHLSSNQVS